MSTAFWVRPTGDLDAVACAALEAGADGVIVDPEDADAVETVGRLPVAPLEGTSADLSGQTAHFARIEDPDDQEDARALLGSVDVIVVQAADWSIIPLENLIAWAQESPTRLYAEVSTAKEAEVARTTLETGAEGLVLATDDPAIVHAVGSRLDEADAGTIELETATVTGIEEAGMGDRVCVDTTSLLEPDEGLLVGSRSAFLALVASEASEAGYVASRPFRVNAGAVHAYVLGPGNETRYLSEVQAGVPLLAVDRDGTTRRVVTGRAKIERRPMLIITLTAEDDEEATVVLQNAETIRLVTPEGPKSVADLAEGDTVRVHRPHAGGRHFGTAIDETIREV